ncbi:helix-turn-helix domain-containing protein [Spirillospora sp. CA-142024]|uniref:helix-turn-helix domain-containing protein n=1 Tax=Spirillospora sp. CA-142024 TaxID=3240036 RepID=UPI003D93E1A1
MGVVQDALGDRVPLPGVGVEPAGRGRLDGLSLRRLARELNVQTAALYRHFANKQELLDWLAGRA